MYIVISTASILAILKLGNNTFSLSTLVSKWLHGRAVYEGDGQRTEKWGYDTTRRVQHGKPVEFCRRYLCFLQRDNQGHYQDLTPYYQDLHIVWAPPFIQSHSSEVFTNYSPPCIPGIWSFQNPEEYIFLAVVLLKLWLPFNCHSSNECNHGHMIMQHLHIFTYTLVFPYKDLLGVSIYLLPFLLFTLTYCLSSTETQIHSGHILYIWVSVSQCVSVHWVSTFFFFFLNMTGMYLSFGRQ